MKEARISMEDEVIIQQTPHIAKLEVGETFLMNLPECCKLFAEGSGDVKNCPHVLQPAKRIKTNIGL